MFESGRGRVALLVDLEGTLTKFSPTQESVNEVVDRFDLIAREKGVDLQRVHYVSNAAFTSADDRNSGRIHLSAQKPWFNPTEEFQQPGTVVVGDQYLTDGLLAWRYGLEFALVESLVRPPAWPRLQFFIGRALSGVFFREMENAEPGQVAQEQAPDQPAQ